jgi:hypothetical protein
MDQILDFITRLPGRLLDHPILVVLGLALCAAAYVSLLVLTVRVENWRYERAARRRRY